MKNQLWLDIDGHLAFSGKDIRLNGIKNQKLQNLIGFKK